MAKESISDRANRAYSAARENRYVQRLVEDEDLRASIVEAIGSARKAYDRFSEDPSLERATHDRRVQKELGRAAESLRDASERLTGPPRRRHTFRNLLVLGLLTGGLVLIFSETARKAALDAVFGYAVSLDLTRRDLQADARTRRDPLDVAKWFEGAT
ncbi:MAG: hypothetical protein ACO3CR_06640, partial [Solirubrobacterales bacterium]